jgi:hypothetical protein
VIRAVIVKEWLESLTGVPSIEAKTFYFLLPSIHSSNFLEELFTSLNRILSHSSHNHLKVLIECQLEGNKYRTLAPSIHVSQGLTLAELEDTFNERIENFESQSGSGEAGQSVIGARVLITNITSAPNPTCSTFLF